MSLQLFPTFLHHILMINLKTLSHQFLCSLNLPLLPFAHHLCITSGLILLFRHVNHISSKNFKHLQSNFYLYSLQISLCFFTEAFKHVSSHSEKNIIMRFKHSRTSSLKYLLKVLASLLSSLFITILFPGYILN